MILIHNIGSLKNSNSNIRDGRRDVVLCISEQLGQADKESCGEAGGGRVSPLSDHVHLLAIPQQGGRTFRPQVSPRAELGLNVSEARCSPTNED